MKIIPVFAGIVEVWHLCHLFAGKAQISGLTQTQGRKNCIRASTKESGSWTVFCTATLCLPGSNVVFVALRSEYSCPLMRVNLIVTITEGGK